MHSTNRMSHNMKFEVSCAVSELNILHTQIYIYHILSRILLHTAHNKRNRKSSLIADDGCTAVETVHNALCMYLAKTKHSASWTVFVLVCHKIR